MSKSLLVPGEQGDSTLVPDVSRDAESGHLDREEKRGTLLVEVDRDLDALAALLLSRFSLVDPFQVGTGQERGKGLAKLNALLVTSIGGALD